MEPTEEEDDVKLAKASVGLLADLESQLPNLLWKRSKSDGARGAVHSSVRQKDLDYVIRLVDPFQSEPHLLDSRLKAILPPIIEAYLEALLKPAARKTEIYVDIQTALSSVLYTFCKVRGPKVIVGFLNNEPRYLEPVLSSLEAVSSKETSEDVDWKVPYILLLWLSHLLLTPFDLASISAGPVPESQKIRLDIPGSVPPVAQRILHLGIRHLSSPTKAQDAAAAMLVRLATRPDMQKLQIADMLVDFAINELSPSPDLPTTIYQQVGPLRFLAGVATSADLGHLIPGIHRACERLYGDTSLPPIASNAVGKKLIVKVFRNIAILTLRSSSASGALLSFLETTDVLEDVIDHLLQSLGDRDTPVRYAAAKAISLIVSELVPEMGHEVIQAVLDTFKQDIPRNASNIDYQTVNALKWHGLTLTLSHALFKRSASPEQLPDILDALVSTLNFEQRTATGSSIGTNVRDAANFGMWSLSRRYTSDELLSVQVKDLRSASPMLMQFTVIQAMAVQLLLSACLDPAGNIRRGSSAALQELIGRHPNQVVDGIAVVQIVDYQAVGLRKRALIDVARKAASLHHLYWTALVEGLVAWRGLGSVDAISREAAAQSLADLVAVGNESSSLPFVSEKLHKQLVNSSGNDTESLHGLLSALANMLRLPVALLSNGKDGTGLPLLHREYWAMVESQGVLQVDFNPRTLKSELPVAITKLVTEVCRVERINCKDEPATFVSSSRAMESIVQRLLTRQEDQILQALPEMARQTYQVRKLTYEPLGCLDASTLSEAVTKNGTKAVLNGAGRAIALGATASLPEGQLAGEEATIAITTLTGLVTTMNVDWRIIGLRALDLALQDLHTTSECDSNILTTAVQAIHDGLTDYTIDERGDIGSLVRLQGLVCASRLLSLEGFDSHRNHYQLLQGDVLRLSLEKLDRVRSNAASCRRNCLPIYFNVDEIENVNSKTYLQSALHPIFDPQTPSWAHRALLEGAISCAGISGESMLQTTRTILTESLHAADEQHLHTTLSTFSDILRDLLSPSTPNAGNLMLAALELLAFLLDMRIPQRLARPQTPTTAFKWRSLLSTVQKSHHKSTDVPKLLAAVSVYKGLAEIESLRGEVVKKLLSMLATNPYPRVRLAVAEVVFEVLGGEEMKGLNWAEKGAGQSRVLAELKREAVGSV